MKTRAAAGIIVWGRRQFQPDATECPHRLVVATDLGEVMTERELDLGEAAWGAAEYWYDPSGKSGLREPAIPVLFMRESPKFR